MWWASLTVTLRVASKKDEDDVLTLGVDQREHLDDELVPEVGRILVDTPACSTSVRWTLVEHSWNTRGTRRTLGVYIAVLDPPTNTRGTPVEHAR